MVLQGGHSRAKNNHHRRRTGIGAGRRSRARREGAGFAGWNRSSGRFRSARDWSSSEMPLRRSLHRKRADRPVRQFEQASPVDFSHTKCRPAQHGPDKEGNLAELDALYQCPGTICPGAELSARVERSTRTDRVHQFEQRRRCEAHVCAIRRNQACAEGDRRQLTWRGQPPWGSGLERLWGGPQAKCRRRYTKRRANPFGPNCCCSRRTWPRSSSMPCSCRLRLK